MTWTHFTAYLDASRDITAAERDELLDNFADLLAGDCAAAGYTINEDDLALVKASQLLTDRACLDGPAASYLCARLHDLLEAASGAFTNYDDAVATALDDEGITEAERDAILTTESDHHHLWNYYKRLLDLLECGTCEVPLFEFQRRTATVVRYGFPGFTDTSKFFRTCVSRGWGPSPFGSGWALARAVCTYPAAGGSPSGAGEIGLYDAACFDGQTLPPPDACHLDDEDPCALPVFAPGGDYPSNVTARAVKLLPDTPGELYPRGYDHLLNEISDATFLAEVRAAARAASWVSDTGDPIYSYIAAYQRKGGNITSVAIKQTRFRFRHKVPPSGGYRVTWELWFQPRTWDGAAWVEGAAVKVADQSYEWDGATPGGYDAGDNATWPLSPWIELPEPVEDGGWTLRGLFFECGTVPTPTAPDGLQAIEA